MVKKTTGKRTVVVGLILMILVCGVAEASFRYNNINRFNVMLTIKEETATCTAQINGTGTIQLKATLEDSSGKVVKEWSDSGSKAITFRETCSGLKSGQEYTLTVTATVGEESATKSKTATCP